MTNNWTSPLPYGLYFAALLVCIAVSFFLPNVFAKAAPVRLMVEADAGPTDTVKGAGDSVVPVYTLKPSEELTLHATLSYTPAEAGDPTLRVTGLSDIPVSCGVVAVEYKSSYGASAGSGGKICEIYFTTDSSQKTRAAKVDFKLRADSLAPTGEYEISITGSSSGSDIEQTILLRIEGISSFEEDPATCEILNINRTLELYQGEAGSILVRVSVPFASAQINQISLQQPTGLPKGVGVTVQGFKNTSGVGLVVPVQIAPDTQAGLYDYTFGVKLIANGEFSGLCEGTLLVRPAIKTFSLSPKQVVMETGDSVQLQALVTYGDNTTQDMASAPQMSFSSQDTSVVRTFGSKIGASAEGETTILGTLTLVVGKNVYVVSDSILVRVTQPTDFSFVLDPNHIITHGGTTSFPVAIKCFNNFSGSVKDITIEYSPFSPEVGFSLYDSLGVQTSRINSCNESLTVVVTAAQFAQPASEPPPFESPQTFVISGVGESLVKDVGYGLGKRIGLANLIVFSQPEITLQTPTPVLVGQSTVLTWTTEHVTACTALGSDGGEKWTGTQLNNNEKGQTIGPFNQAGHHRIGLMCNGAFGSAQTTWVDVLAESPSADIPTLADTILDNSVCLQVHILWPEVASAISYSLFKDTSSVGAFKTQVMDFQANTRDYTDTHLEGTTFVYYWLQVRTPDGVKQYYLGGTGVLLCKPDVSLSDVDITAVGGTEFTPGVQNACSGASEKLDSTKVGQAGSIVTFAIHICNSGQHEFTLKTLTSELSYLEVPDEGLHAEYSYTDIAGKGIVKSIPDKNISITGPPENRTLLFKDLGTVLGAHKGKTVFSTLSFNAKIYLPTTARGESFRYRNMVTFAGRYTDTNKAEQSITQSITTPAYLFYYAGRSPKKEEQAN